MPFGHHSASSAVRLNYAAIVEALDAQLLNKRVKDNTFVYAFRPNLKLMRGNGNDVVLHMYQTNIVTFHPDGTKTLNSGGYCGSLMTRHWLREGCGYQHIYQARPNDWSPQYRVYHNHGDPVLFYDGMKVDKDNTMISERRPMVKLLPNAEAKELRVRILAVVREHYLPHLQMLGTDHNWRDKIPSVLLNGDLINHLLKGGFDFDVLHGVLSSRRFASTPALAMKKAVDDSYRATVVLEKMVSEHPYQPKGN